MLHIYSAYDLVSKAEFTQDKKNPLILTEYSYMKT